MLNWNVDEKLYRDSTEGAISHQRSAGIYLSVATFYLIVDTRALISLFTLHLQNSPEKLKFETIASWMHIVLMRSHSHTLDPNHPRCLDDGAYFQTCITLESGLLIGWFYPVIYQTVSRILLIQILFYGLPTSFSLRKMSKILQSFKLFFGLDSFPQSVENASKFELFFGLSRVSRILWSWNYFLDFFFLRE